MRRQGPDARAQASVVMSEDATLVAFYPGDPDTAGLSLRAACASNGARVRPTTVTWIGSGLLVTYEPRPSYDTMRFVLGVAAALALGFAAVELVGIHSAQADSVLDAFFHAVGIVSGGLALLAVAVGLRRG